MKNVKWLGLGCAAAMLCAFVVAGCAHKNEVEVQANPAPVWGAPPLLFPWSEPVISGGKGDDIRTRVKLSGISTYCVYLKVVEKLRKEAYPEHDTYGREMIITDNEYVVVYKLRRRGVSGEEADYDADLAWFYVEMPELAAKPHVGVYGFFKTKSDEVPIVYGAVYNMNFIEDDAFWNSWSDWYGNESGIFVSQTEPEQNHGVIAIGAIENGKRHGEWKFVNRENMTTLITYEMGEAQSTLVLGVDGLPPYHYFWR